MSEYTEKLAAIMKKGNAILADLGKIAKKMESIKEEVFPNNKSLSKEDIESCPPLKRKQARYNKKADEFGRNVEALIALTDNE
jgi:HEPN domain-containing protein